VWDSNSIHPTVCVDELFCSIDTNQDGYLSLGDVESVLGVVASMFLRAVCQVGTDVDASLLLATPAQFRSWATHAHKANNHVQKELEKQLAKVRDGVVRAALEKFDRVARKLQNQQASSQLGKNAVERVSKNETHIAILAANNFCELLGNAGEATGFIE
jgi:hypothetical protein